MATKEDAVLRLARARQNDSAPDDPKWDDLEPDDQALLVQNASADLALMASIGLLVIDADPPAPRGNACSCPPGPIGEGDYCGTQSASIPDQGLLGVLRRRVLDARKAHWAVTHDAGKDFTGPLPDALRDLFGALTDPDVYLDAPVVHAVARALLGEDVQP